MDLEQWKEHMVEQGLAGTFTITPAGTIRHDGGRRDVRGMRCCPILAGFPPPGGEILPGHDNHKAHLIAASHGLRKGDRNMIISAADGVFGFSDDAARRVEIGALRDWMEEVLVGCG